MTVTDDDDAATFKPRATVKHRLMANITTHEADRLAREEPPYPPPSNIAEER